MRFQRRDITPLILPPSARATTGPVNLKTLTQIIDKNIRAMNFRIQDAPGPSPGAGGRSTGPIAQVTTLPPAAPPPLAGFILQGYKIVRAPVIYLVRPASPGPGPVRFQRRDTTPLILPPSARATTGPVTLKTLPDPRCSWPKSRSGWQVYGANRTSDYNPSSSSTNLDDSHPNY